MLYVAADCLTKRQCRVNTRNVSLVGLRLVQNRFFHPVAKRLIKLDVAVAFDLPEGLIDLPLDQGLTPLARAICFGTRDQVAALVSLGANIDLPDLRGVPPMIHATLARRADMVKLLIDLGGDPDRPDANERIALHFAFYLGDEDIIKTLVKKSAGFLKCDVDGRGIVDYARADLPEKNTAKWAAQAECLGEKSRFEPRPAGMGLPSEPGPAFPDLRGHRDFRRLDWAIAAPDMLFGSFSRYGLLAGAFFAVLTTIGPGALLGAATESVFLGVVGVYLALALRLTGIFLIQEDEAPADTTHLSIGSTAREVFFVLRFASRALLSRLDETLDTKADTSGLERQLWWLALGFPVILMLGVALIAGVFALVLYWLSSLDPDPGSFFALIAAGLIFLWFFVTLAAVVVGIPTLLVLMRLLFFAIASGILADKITTRQTAFSAHINARKDLREGGKLADRGVLYLRSFETDGKFVLGGIDFELMLLRVFEGIAPLYALSLEEQSRGALMVRTDDRDWKEVVTNLLRQAGLVLIIPADTPGVLDELAALERGGWFSKTVFLAPPESEDQSVGPAWERMRRHDALRHLEIPPYCDAGFLFRLDPAGRLCEASPLGMERAPLPQLEDEDLKNLLAKLGIDWPEDTQGTTSVESATEAVGNTSGSAESSASFEPSVPASAQSASTAAQTSVSATTSHLWHLNQIMQSVPQLTQEQFAAMGAMEQGDGIDMDIGG